METKNKIKASDIDEVIASNFVPLVGVKEMKVYLLDDKNEPINPEKVSNSMEICEDGWRYTIVTGERDCREFLISGIGGALSLQNPPGGGRSPYKVAIHPPKLSKGMPDRFIRYPTKAVPYLHMGNFEVNSKYFHKNPEVMAKWADVVVGILSVILDRNEATRRAFKEGYLEPGSFESIQEKGMGYIFEYHSLSSYWSRCPELISLITAHMRIAARLSLAEYEKKQAINAFWEKTDYDEIRDIIQDHDFERALDMYNKLKQCMVYASKKPTDPMNLSTNKLHFIDYVIMKGIDSMWTSTNIASNFRGGQNGWFTGIGLIRDIESYVCKHLNTPVPSINSIIVPENIEFMKNEEKNL